MKKITDMFDSIVVIAAAAAVTISGIFITMFIAVTMLLRITWPVWAFGFLLYLILK